MSEIVRAMDFGFASTSHERKAGGGDRGGLRRRTWA